MHRNLQQKCKKGEALPPHSHLKFIMMLLHDQWQVKILFQEMNYEKTVFVRSLWDFYLCTEGSLT